MFRGPECERAKGRGVPAERGKDYLRQVCVYSHSALARGTPGWARGVLWKWGGRGQQAGPATSLRECVLGEKDRAESRAAAAAVAAAKA